MRRPLLLGYSKTLNHEVLVPHVSANGLNIHYHQAGEERLGGPDVVLIHAVTSNLALWLFIGLIDRLAERYRVTAYDLRGHGMTECPPTGYTSADTAADFIALHERLGLGPAYLVGHSFGAVTALHAAVLAPERVAGVVLADPYFPGLAHIEPNLPKASVWVDLRSVFSSAGVEIGEDIDFSTLFRTVADLTPEQAKAVKEKMGGASWRWLAGLPPLAGTTCGRDLFEVAGLTEEAILSVRQPVVALYDEHSPFLATCRHLEKHLAHCTVDLVPGARHLAPIQNPSAFVAQVRQHLDVLVDVQESKSQSTSTKASSCRGS